MSRKPSTRRAFLRLVAAGSVAALAAPAALAETVAPKRTKPAPPPPAKPTAEQTREAAARLSRPRDGEGRGRVADPAEIAKARKYTEDTARALRDYPLEPGQAPAFTFQPLAPRRGRRTR